MMRLMGCVMSGLLGVMITSGMWLIGKPRSAFVSVPGLVWMVLLIR